MRILLLRFWYKNNAHWTTKEPEAMQRHQESATTRTLLELDVQGSASVKELKELLQDEAKRVNPQDDSLDSTWTLKFARIIREDCDFAFSDDGSFQKREYFEGDDSTTVEKLLEQQNTLRESDSTLDRFTLRLYVVERRPPPGNVHFKTLTGKVVSISIPEETFGQTTIREAQDLLCEQTGMDMNETRLIYQNKQPQLENTFESYDIQPKATFLVLLRLKSRITPAQPDASISSDENDDKENIDDEKSSWICALS
jgi:hypothetical protein